ncbi:MAG: nitroreductase family deazaflavin-dependent oxidoreductase [Pseudomonadota bacterium]
MNIKRLLSEGFPQDLLDYLNDHMTRYLETDGEDGYLWDSTPTGGKGMVTTLILRTTGRKTGKELALPLIFGEDNGDIIIIASKAGYPQHPAWFLNLQASGEAEVQIKAERFKVDVRVAESDERTRLWQMMVDIYPPYTSYQEATERQIPVVVLTKKQ